MWCRSNPIRRRINIRTRISILQFSSQLHVCMHCTCEGTRSCVTFKAKLLLKICLHYRLDHSKGLCLNVKLEFVIFNKHIQDVDVACDHEHLAFSPFEGCIYYLPHCCILLCSILVISLNSCDLHFYQDDVRLEACSKNICILFCLQMVKLSKQRVCGRGTGPWSWLCGDLDDFCAER